MTAGYEYTALALDGCADVVRCAISQIDDPDVLCSADVIVPLMTAMTREVGVCVFGNDYSQLRTSSSSTPQRLLAAHKCKLILQYGVGLEGVDIKTVGGWFVKMSPSVPHTHHPQHHQRQQNLVFTCPTSHPASLPMPSAVQRWPSTSCSHSPVTCMPWRTALPHSSWVSPVGAHCMVATHW